MTDRPLEVLPHAREAVAGYERFVPGHPSVFNARPS